MVCKVPTVSVNIAHGQIPLFQIQKVISSKTIPDIDMKVWDEKEVYFNWQKHEHYVEKSWRCSL